ncbi:hypothetical protein B0H15DRAFT_1006496 [Mycena belliarum]|uniref:Uncharacterized protein n=1 Tax=Mycena belliarum TaxID=1033014 RepID=A0AAD6XJS2_9AGAR|nr:hypothetical protein B0H15DRAFT_1006496 [Mycena belliae]
MACAAFVFFFTTKRIESACVFAYSGATSAAIGGPKKTLDFTATFYNDAMAQGRQVPTNDRCGFLFDTPVYKTDVWEHPHSQLLPQLGDERQPVQEWLDHHIDARCHRLEEWEFPPRHWPQGRRRDHRQIMDNLLDAGLWFDFAGACEYWLPAPQDPNLQRGTTAPRFTTTPTALGFCIVALSQPRGGQVTINKRLPDPVFAGDGIVQATSALLP